MNNTNKPQSGEEPREKREDEERTEEASPESESPKDVEEETPQPEEGEKLDEVNHSEVRGFLDWIDETFGKGAQQDLPTDLLIEQFLFWSHPGVPQKEEIKARLEEYFGTDSAKNRTLIEKIKDLADKVYRPDRESSFPWQTVMAKLLDERVQELQNVNYDATIRYKRFQEACKNKDEFSSQVILLSLATTSDFKQEWLDEYYQTFAQRDDSIENPDTKKKQTEYVPDSRQLWFENKLRRTAHQAKTWYVWHGPRFELDENKKVRLKSREEVAKGADYDTALIGGRRGDLAGEGFTYNTYTDQAEVDATNQLLRQKIDLLDKEIAQYQKLAGVRQLLSKEKKTSHKDVKELETKIEEHKRQKKLIEDIVAAGGYKVGDLKTMLLDPLANRESFVVLKKKEGEEEEKKGEKKYYEKDLAMDLGFTKFMTGKLATDVQITLRGEHAIPQDIAAFVHILGLRRIQEFKWACQHSFLGARVYTTGEYDDKRNTYKNSLARMLDDSDQEARSFTRMALGFYFENGKILAIHDKSGQTVILGDYTNQVRQNIEKTGYLDPDTPLEERQKDLEDKIEKAYQANNIWEGETPKREFEQVLGDLAREIKENKNVDNAVADMIKHSKEIDLSGLEEELKTIANHRRDPEETSEGIIASDLTLSVDKLASDIFGINDPDLDNLVRQKFVTEFKTPCIQGENPSIPQINEEELTPFREQLEKKGIDIQAKLKELNEELEKSCRALKIAWRMQEKLLPIFGIIKVKEEIDLEEIESAIKLITDKPDKVEQRSLFSRIQKKKEELQTNLKKLTEFREDNLVKKFDALTDFSRPLSGEQKIAVERLFADYEADIKLDTISVAELIRVIDRYELVYKSLLQKCDKLVEKLPEQLPPAEPKSEPKPES